MEPVRKAVVEGGVIVNVIEIGEGFVPPDGVELIDAPFGAGREIGAVLVGGEWVMPEPE